MRILNSSSTRTRLIPWLRRAALACAATVLFGIGANAQVAAYSFDGSTVGIYTPITGGTVLGTTTSDDQYYVTPVTPAGGTTNNGIGFPIGFTFNYNGVAYDRVGVNTNGWIALGQSALTPSVNMATTSAYTPLASTAAITPTQLRGRIAGLGADLQGQTGSEIRIETIGTAPNQTLVVQWTNYKRFSTSGTGQSLNWQIRLNQANDVVAAQTVEIVYGTMTFNATSSTAHVGLGGSASTEFNNRSTTTDWNATTAGAVNTASCTFLNTVTAPVSGRTFRWTPPLPCAGTPSAGTVPSTIGQCTTATTGNVITASGFTTGFSGLSFQWEQSPDGSTGWAPVTGGTGATTTSYTTPVLVVPTWYRMRITCANGGGTDVSSNVCAVSLISCTFDVTYTNGAAWSSIMPVNGGSGLALSGWLNTSGDDNSSTTQSLAGTSFRYQGNLVTGFQMCSNGWMTFNTANTSTTFSNSLTSTTQNRVLAPFWDDLVFTGQAFASRDACARYQVIGTLGSGSAIIVMEWAGLERFNIPGPNMNFQVRLYEGTNVIEYVYGDFQGYDGTYNNTNAAWTSSYSIGYNGSNPAGTTGADRFGMQTTTRVTNFFAASDPGTGVGMPDCFSKFTFTPGVYTGPVSAPAVPVPSNDDSGNAITVTAFPAPCTAYCGTYYTSLGATNSGLGPNSCTTTAGNEDDDVWFKFTANGLADYTIRLRSSPNYDGVLQLIAADATTNIACVNATGVGLIETYVATAPPAGTYYVRVFHNGATVGTSSGQFSLCVSEVVPPPANDEICGATNVPLINPCTPISGSTLSATTSTTTPVPTCGSGSLVDVWYSFTANTSGDVITVQSGTGFNAAVAIYGSSDNLCGGTLTQVVCQNATSTAGEESSNGPWVPGNTYFVRVYHAAGGIGGSGSFTICRTIVAPLCTSLTSPADAATVSTNPVPLVWAASAGATSYAVYVSQTNPPPLVTPTATVSTTNYDFVPSPYTPCDVWYWTVVPSNVAGPASNQPCVVRSFSLGSATCVPPTALTSAASSITSGTIGWTASISGPGTYELYWSTSPTAPVCATPPTITGITGTSQAISGLPASSTIYAWVRSNCGAGDLSSWAAAPSFFTGYCVPVSSGSACLTNVTFGATLNNTSPACASPFYTSFIGGGPSTTGSFERGVTYPFSFTTDAAAIVSVWFDWNQDLVFDATEHFQPTLNASTGTINITIPVTAAFGQIGMRVRSRLTGNTNGAVDACTVFGSGEAEDYAINICQQPSGTVSIADNCAGDNFVITVNEATLASGTIQYSIDGVAQTPVAFTGPSTSLPAIADSSNVSVTLSSGGCSQNLGSFGSACPVLLNCGAPALNYNYCYKNADTRTWTFNNPGGTVALKFVSGTMDTNDNLLFWEGAVGGTPHVAYPTLTGTLDGILVVSTGPTLSVSISAGASNSCFDGGQGAPWTFQVRCGGCVEPSGFIATDVGLVGLPAELNCAALPDPTFNAYIAIASNGIDANTAAAPNTVGYRLFVNNVLTATVTGLLGEFDAATGDGTDNPYFLGTFPLGTDIDVVLLHQDQTNQSICNNPVVTNFTVPFNACPPVNDQCVNAIDLTVNAPANCPASAISGTTRGADLTGATPACGATPVQDVWYHINTVGFAQPIMTVTDGTATVVGAELFTACGTPLAGYCVADATVGPLIVNAPQGDYWIRFFTTAAGAGTFSVCITGELAGYECNGAINIPSIPVTDQALVCSGVVSPGILNATNVPLACGSASNSYKGGEEAIYTYTATTSGPQNISINGPTWTSIFVYSGACPTNGGVCVGSVGTSATTKSLQVNMVAGTTYYIWFDVFPAPNSPCPGTFSIATPPAPPVNDDPCGAIAVVPGSTCSFVVRTTANATATAGVPAPTCANYAGGDVWFSTVVPASGDLTFDSNTGVITDLGMEIYYSSDNTCTGTLTSIECDDDDSVNGLMSFISRTDLTPGATVFVRCWEYGNDNPGTFSLCIFEPPPPPAPPANDECVAATPLTVNPSLTCTAQTAGTVTSATASGVAIAPCGGTADDDVWYSFVATYTTHTIALNSVAGSTTDLYHALYSGSCGALTNILCSDPNTSTATGLIIGQTYYLRVFTWTATAGQTSTFSVCIGTPPLPPANDECVNAVALTVNPTFTCTSSASGTVASATASAGVVAPCSGTADDDVWYSFVATNTAHRVSLLNITGSTTDMYMAFYSGTCAAPVSVFCSDPNTADLTGLSIGATYYVRVYTWTATTGQTSAFSICVGTPPPPPANDNCAGAVSLPVSAGLTCTAQTAGTLQSATDSGTPVAPCTGVVNDDVWYSFTATASQHIITLSSVTPVTTMRMQLFSGACGSLAHVECATTNSYTTSNTLVAGTTYFLRVYSLGSIAVGTTFNVCVTTPPPGPPVNDECAGALSVPVNAGPSCSSQTFGTVFAATPSTGAVTPCVGTADDDVWFSFVAIGTSHTVSLNSVTGSVTSMNFAAYSGACGTLTNIGCGATGTAPSTNLSGLTVGNTYYVRVYTNTATGGQNTTFNVCVTSPPANDLCANAVAVTCNSVTAGSTLGSSTTGAPGTCITALNTAGGVWYTVTGWGGPMTASLCGSSFDTKIGIFTGVCGSLVCVNGNDDDTGTGGASVCGGGVQSSTAWSSVNGTTYYIYVTGFSTNVGSFSLAVRCGNLGACASGGNALNLEFQNDANPGQVTWTLLNEAGNQTVLSGADPIPANQIGTQSMCVPNGCYQLRVNDSAGDGMTTGGYELRLAEAIPEPRRIIDNTNNFSTGSVSQIANGLGFCLPMGVSKPIYSSCDKLDWVTNKFIVATEDPLVSAQYNVTNTTSGYVFWFFDPNGSYSFRRFRSHATSDGFGTGATRANHFRLNAWTNTPSSPHLPENVLLNVRIRSRIAGVNQEWGPACQFKMDAALAACPLVNLQDNPANVNDYSCGVNRNWGGSNQGSNKIVADPPQFFPAVPGGSTRYQFRFRNSERCIVLPPQTSATRYLNWNVGVAEPLVVTETYEVDVRVSKDGGATWCTGLASTDASSNCADLTPWGKICLVTITGSNAAQGGSSSMALEGGNLTMYPNPNRGDQVRIALSEVAADVNTVSVDIYDMTGKRVTARTIAVQDGFVKTNIDLNGDLAGGLYMVNVTAGDKTYTERLVIQP